MPTATKSLTLCLAQLPNSPDADQNEAAIKALLEQVTCDLLLLPECMLTGFGAKPELCTRAILDARIARIEEVARAVKTSIILPAILRTGEGAHLNMGAIIDVTQRGEAPSFAKLGLTESERRFFSTEGAPTARVFRCGKLVIGIIICREIADAPQTYFSASSEPDVILWPGYWRWEGDEAWHEESEDAYVRGAVRLARFWRAPILQANFSHNDTSDARQSGPNGRSVVLDEEGALLHQGVEGAPSVVLVTLDRQGATWRISHTQDAALDGR